MTETTKIFSIVDVHAFRNYPSHDEDDSSIVTADRWSFMFDCDERMDSVIEGETWVELCEPFLSDLALWAEQRAPKGDDWISFRFYTLWEIHFHKSYCWEYGTYEYDSEAYCLGLLDEKKWTPESLGLVAEAKYE